jgi:hypothetical protein
MRKRPYKNQRDVISAGSARKHRNCAWQSKTVEAAVSAALTGTQATHLPLQHKFSIDDLINNPRQRQRGWLSY